MSHTPGPWYWRGGKSVEVRTEHDGGIGFHLATIRCGDSDTDKANAALIAAAPELLEALKGLLEFVAEKAPLADPRVDAAEAKIAKAEGK